MGSAAYSLGAGQSRTFTVRFAPSQPGQYRCAIGTGCARSVGASGLAVVPTECLVSPTSLDFGPVPIGQSVDRTFTITNSGGGTLSGTVLAPCGSAGYAIVGQASYSLGPQQSANITVRFAPTAAGSFDCVIDAGAAACASVTCRGSSSACELSATSLDFGEVLYGSRRSLTLAVTNRSTSSQTFLPDETCPDFFVRPTALTLGPGETGSFTATYEALRCGTHDCGVNLGQCGRVTLHGSTRPEIDFGDVAIGQVVEREVVVQEPCGYEGTYKICPDEYCGDFEIWPPCRSDYTAIFPLTYSLHFRPTQVGPQNCTVQILVKCAPLDPGFNVVREICLTGSGYLAPGTPVCRVSTTLLDYGTVAVGQSKDLTLTIRNDGGGALTGSAQPSGCDWFTVQGSSSFALTAGQSAQFTIRFTPPQAGHAYTCYIFVLDPLCEMVVLTGEGR